MQTSFVYFEFQNIRQLSSKIGLTHYFVLVMTLLNKFLLLENFLKKY